MGRLKVLVVGAGVGGISAARGLLRDGHDGTATFSHADRVGNRLKNWKMKPTR
jgi:cation diffusion facilitator CzcD-associated flavoprotein CzcO